jgi:AcrR family transcriptional regulator
MAWDTEGTKRKILDAAADEFARSGPEGTTIERIAKLAGVNKERIYNYFGGKLTLFSQVLRDQLTTAAIEVPERPGEEEITEYAGRLYDYHRQHPALARLLQWEALTFDADVPEEHSRRDFYQRNTSALASSECGQAPTSTIPPDLMQFLLLSIAGYWAVLPQVARMVTGVDPKVPAEDARRRAAVLEAARRLASA